MDFLEKLDYLMNRDKLNKSTLSKACNIPYTTIDGWYKKGNEGLKLTTLRKLANFFGTSLDFWASDQLLDDIIINDEVKQLSKQYSLLKDRDRELVKNMIDSLSEKTVKDSSDAGGTCNDNVIEVYKAARSTSGKEHGIVLETREEIERLKQLPRVTRKEDL